MIGYKYFDFGSDDTTKTLLLAMKLNGTGIRGCLHVWIDAPDEERGGKCIGKLETDLHDGEYTARVESVTGRHALYFVAERYKPKDDWMDDFFKDRTICEIEEFVFMK